MLSLAPSNDLNSRADGRVVFTGVFDLWGGRIAGGGCGLRADLGEESLDPLGSGALKVRVLSLARLDREFPAVTVRALAGLEFSFGSCASLLATGCGLRAWATARGPAHCGNIGSATLASTKLERTVTGSTFSVIFSCRAASASPKTICWTLLYTRRHVWNESDEGFDDRSWRYV